MGQLSVKKEKYINQQSHNGRKYFVVRFRYIATDGSECVYRKEFNAADYELPSMAMKAACDHRDLMRAKLLTDGLPSKEKTTVDNLMSHYSDIYRQTAGSTRAFLYAYNNYIQKFCGSRPIDSITAFDIQRTVNDASKVLGDKSLARILTLWRKIYHIGQMLNIPLVDKTSQIIMPKGTESPQHKSSVKQSDLDLIVNYFKNKGIAENAKYNNALIADGLLIMRYTGLRPAEAFGLRRSDIGQSITITHSLGIDADFSVSTRPAKTRLSNRSIPISPDCRQVLDHALSLSENEYIFMTYQGNLPNVSKIASKVAQASKTLGITFRMYDLRHQFATDLITNGVDPRTVMELMGHAGAGMTLSYARSDEAKKSLAIEKVNKSE